VAEAEEFWFDEDAASRAVEFIETLCHHWKGEWAGKPFLLLDWEKQIVRDLFGWKRQDGTRRYRWAFITVAKKNGKTLLGAAIALLLLFADGEPGAEIYSAAADRRQASLVFEDAKQMRLRSKALSRRSTQYARSIWNPALSARYEVLSSDVPTKHGLNPHGILVDELHALPNAELFDTLAMGTAARRQPLVVMITTAGIGSDTESLWWQQYDYAKKVLAYRAGDTENGIRDDTFYAAIYEAAEKDDWRLEETWLKANPSLGVSVKLDYLRTECAKAERNRRYQATFRRLHCNQPQDTVETVIDMIKWDAITQPVDAIALRRQICYVGMDLSSKLDITALVAVFRADDGGYLVLPYFWLPAENLAARVRRDRAPYDLWAEDGHLELTEGNLVDQDAIRKRVNQLDRLFRVEEVGFDSWNATAIQSNLQDKDGITTVEMRQGYKTMSEPTKHMVGLVEDGRLYHGNHPVLRWMAKSMAVRKDSNDNWSPCKKKSTQRIDGMVALAMALGRALVNVDEGSVYDEQEVRYL